MLPANFNTGAISGGAVWPRAKQGKARSCNAAHARPILIFSSHQVAWQLAIRLCRIFSRLPRGCQPDNFRKCVPVRPCLQLEGRASVNNRDRILRDRSLHSQPECLLKGIRVLLERHASSIRVDQRQKVTPKKCAGSTGRCNTLEHIDLTALPIENRSVRSDSIKT